MAKVFIVEDHELYLEGLTLLLERYHDIVVAGSSRNGNEFLSRLPHLEDDVILLLDVHLPDTEPEELMIRVRELRPNLRIIFLTLMRGTRFLHKLMKYGIQGYILKSAPVEELIQAIQTVEQGGTSYSKEIDILTKDDDARNTLMIDSSKVDEILTRREKEILQLVCKEYSNAEIASQLFLSVGTVETHRKRIIAKLGVNNTVGLVKFAIRNGLID
jgi:two-component system, NarL family, response regulator NreC